MSDEKNLTVAEALRIVIDGCQDHYDMVVREAGVHPLYREALPIARHLLQVIESNPDTVPPEMAL